MSAWSEADDEALYRMWVVEGQSASLCARALGNRTRNSVIGRVSRKEWNRAQASAPTLKVAYPKRAAPKQHRRRHDQPAPAFVRPGWKDSAPLPPTIILKPGQEIASPNARPWIERVRGECCFPVGDITSADQRSCCNVIFGAGVYCQAHTQLAYRPSSSPPTFPKNDRTAKAEPKDDPDPRPLDFEDAA